MRSPFRILLAALSLAGAAQGCGQQFALHDGDRVAFYGDSITAQRLYTRFVEDFVITRYPQLHVDFWNAGVPGDTAYGGYTGDVQTRLRRDLFPRQPTVVTIMLGMNDGYYMAFNQKYLDIFKSGYGTLYDAIAAGAPGARITLISSTPYDEVTHGTEFAHYNETVSRNANAVKEFAVARHASFSDFNQDVSALLPRAVQKNPSLAPLLVPDRIHPAEASHWIMAVALMRSWGASAVVSTVWIHGATAETAATENTQIAALTSVDGKLQWTQTDGSLPLPLPLDDAMIQFVLGISDLGEVDRQMLRVDGLPAPRYALKIDGHEIVSLSREQWAAGVNLALYPTPMESQAKGVDGLALKRTRLDEARFILGVEDPNAAENAAAVKAIEARETGLATEERKTAQPKPHQFELVPQ